MRYSPPDHQSRERFHQGTSRRAYEMLGAHPVEMNGKDYWHFAVWAPNARAVSLVGEFNEWKKDLNPMTKQYDGTWEIRIPAEVFDISSNPAKYNYENAAQKLTTYKYAVCTCDGEWVEKADPYAFFSEVRPNMASCIYDLEGYDWGDGAYMAARAGRDIYRSPMNIYEMHLGSWRRDEKGKMLTYGQIGDQLIPYLLEMGYTHVEFLPVMEHPLDMSWGYQVTGFYSATSRYGKPKELMALIDRLHQNGIGVILDWVPAHFPRDAVGLRRFDGTPCYEHPDPRRGDMPQWGTHMFDLARGEVRSFLLSSACFWLDWFHADGLRVDAVSSMLYYDFCREDGQWLPNMYGGKENLDAISFLRMFNETVYHDFPGVATFAEESHAYPMVTKPTYLGGLGFGFKWNMGWMNDMLAYVEKDPIYRKYHHDKLTFSLMYAFSENYVLPFSHDEVVHGKHSMLDKNPGDIWQKFAGLRALYGYTMAHPGKKLLFMGGEFAHYIEWKFDDQLDWFLLVYDRHPQLQRCVKELNHFYRNTPAFYEVDDGWDGFQWLNANDSDNSIVAFLRTDKKGRAIGCVTNFTPVFHPEYRVALPMPGTLTEVFNTDREAFGGSNQYNAEVITAQEGICNGLPYWANICVPPLATVYFVYDKQLPPEPVKDSEPAAKDPEKPRRIRAAKPAPEAPKAPKPSVKKQPAKQSVKQPTKQPTKKKAKEALGAKERVSP